jgi:hypothetical protein
MPQRCIVAMNRGVTKRSNGPLADAAVAETNAPTEDRSPQVPRSAIFPIILHVPPNFPNL